MATKQIRIIDIAPDADTVLAGMKKHIAKAAKAKAGKHVHSKDPRKKAVVLALKLKTGGRRVTNLVEFADGTFQGDVLHTPKGATQATVTAAEAGLVPAAPATPDVVGDLGRFIEKQEAKAPKAKRAKAAEPKAQQPVAISDRQEFFTKKTGGDAKDAPFTQAAHKKGAKRCTAADCSNVSRSNGMCAFHYNKWNVAERKARRAAEAKKAAAPAAVIGSIKMPSDVAAKAARPFGDPRQLVLLFEAAERIGTNEARDLAMQVALATK